ncbi:MAG: tetratricopeptide repeat protein, partial [Planctomycetota bacterium]|nr:tetratricopeptide repeat protein [Planctomycetota bacterium]
MRQYSLYVLAFLTVFAVTSPLWWKVGNAEEQRIQAWLDEGDPFLWVQAEERGFRPGDGLHNLGWSSVGLDSSPVSSFSSRIRWKPFWGALLHLMTTGCLVFWLLGSGLGRGVALGAGLFFALHPGVFWSVGFPGASGTLWIGFGVALFWSCHAQSGREASSWVWTVLALLGMGITLLCDPRGVVLLAVPWLLEKRGSLQQRILWWLMVPLALLAWIVQWPSLFTGNPYQEWTGGVGSGIRSGITVLGWGVEMLVGPRILSPVPTWEPEALRRYLWGFGVLFVEIVFLTKAVRGDRESRVMAMALGSTLLALFAFSGLGIPSANRVVPEMIYLAAMPAMMFGAMIWSRVLNFSRLRTVTTVLALFLLLVCGVRSIDEADELRSSQRLSNAVLQHEPDSFWAHQEKGLHAIRMFRIDRDPQRWGAGVLHLMNAARSSHSGGSIRPAVAAARVARLWSERSGLSSRRQARRWADQARKIQASRLEESRFQPGLQNGTLAWVEAADAWAAESEGRDEQAKSAMRQACLLEPSEAFWAVELGRILLRTKDFSKSREALDRAVKVDPECAQAYLLRAHLELEEGHITKALHEVGRAFEVANGGQSRSAAWLARASVHREMGQTDLAREAYRGYLAQGKEIQASERAQIHFELAEMEIVERLWSRALRELDQCLELDPGHIQARFREVEIRGQLIGKAFESLLEEAQEDFDAIRSEGARQASPYEVIANEGVRGSIEKRFDHLVEELVAIHKRAVSLTREKDEFIPLQKTVAKFLARLYVFQAGIRLRQGQKDLSQQLVKNALGLDPSCPEIREFRVDWMQVLSADVDEMEDQEKFTLYSKLLIRDPNHLAALKFFAGFWARKKNYGESERCYDRLIEILEPQGLQHWSSVQMEAGTCFFRWSRALRRGARRDEKRYGGSAFERHQRSQRYVGRAVAAFRKVLAISPSHYMARYNLGSLFYSLGDLNRAIEEYESILDKTSDLKKTLA